MCNKIKVEICTGTACYLFGGEDLLSIKDALPVIYKPSVEVIGIRCLEKCQHCNHSNAPFVRINGEIQNKVDKESLKQTIVQIFQDWG